MCIVIAEFGCIDVLDYYMWRGTTKKIRRLANYFEVVNYFSTTFQLQQKVSYKFKFSFIDIV